MKDLDLVIHVERAILDDKKFNFLYEDEKIAILWIKLILNKFKLINLY